MRQPKCVGDLLHGEIEAGTAHTPHDRVEILMDSAVGGSLPVISDWNSRRLLGQIDRATLEGLLADHGEAAHELSLDQAVTSAHTCWLTDSPEAALAVMRAHRVDVVHVIDHRGRLHGSVSWDEAYRYSDSIACGLSSKPARPAIRARAAGKRSMGGSVDTSAGW